MSFPIFKQLEYGSFRPVAFAVLADISSTFGLDRAKFFPYWDNESLLKTTDGTLASFYINPEGNIWLATSQFGDKARTVSYQFDTEKLKLDKNLKAYDIFTGKVFPVSTGNLKLKLKPWKPRVLIIK